MKHITSPDWNTLNPDKYMSNEGERLRLVERDVESLQANDKDKEIRIRDIEKTIWKAFGASAVLQVVIVGALEWLKK